MSQAQAELASFILDRLTRLAFLHAMRPAFGGIAHETFVEHRAVADPDTDVHAFLVGVLPGLRRVAFLRNANEDDAFTGGEDFIEHLAGAGLAEARAAAMDKSRRS